MILDVCFIVPKNLSKSSLWMSGIYKTMISLSVSMENSLDTPFPPIKNVSLRQLLSKNNYDGIEEWYLSWITNMKSLFFSVINGEDDYFNKNINDWDVSNVRNEVYVYE